MVKRQLKTDKTVAQQEIKLIMNNLKDITSSQHTPKKGLTAFDTWRQTTSSLLSGIFLDVSINKAFLTETKVFLNKFTEVDNVNTLTTVCNKALIFLDNLLMEIEIGECSLSQESHHPISKMNALEIIRRILRNFHKHIESMYSDKVHASGEIKQENLAKIKIGNEYDVQRILYSLIRPIFPTARTEVVVDTGYNSNRYDITLNEYDIAIEVKCTRHSMTERGLTEELGADSFHYKTNHLFLFVFDRVKLIKNIDVFENAFNRDEESAGKIIETIVIRDVII